MILKEFFNDHSVHKIIKYVFWLMILLLILCFFLEIYLITDRHSFADLQAGLPDEAWLLERVGPTGLHFNFAYGPIFWSFLALVTKIFPQEYLIFGARILFASLKYIAWLSVAFSYVATRPSFLSLETSTQSIQSLSLEKNYIAPTLFLFCLLTTPGYFFFGKIISPEYMLMLFPALTFCFLYWDRLRFGRNYLWGVFFAMLAAAIKLSGGPFMCIIAAYGPIYLLIKGRISDGIKVSIYCFLMMLFFWSAVFFLCGLSESLDSIYRAISVVPDFNYSLSAIKEAFFRIKLC
jgi:hypothetical protein